MTVPERSGYLYEEGMIFSPDGRCRPFDVGAQGTRGGAGAGVVVLKRLAEALEERDTIHAVIRGVAVNNDGADKAGIHGAQRRRSDRGDRDGPGAGRNPTSRDFLYRDSWNWNAAGRSNRDRSAHRRVPVIDARRRFLPAGIA